MDEAQEAQKLEQLLRRAETVLRARTDRLVLVLERVLDTSNWIGALRTAECLGEARAATQHSFRPSGGARAVRRPPQSALPCEFAGVQNVWVVQLPRGHAQEEKARQKQLAKERSMAGQKLGRGGLKQHGPPAQRKRHHAPGDHSQGQHTGSDGNPDDEEEDAGMAPQQEEKTGPGAAERAEQAASGGGVEAVPEVLGASKVVPEERLKQEIRKRLRFSRASSQWLNVRFFSSTQACVQALREEGCAIWATDLSQVRVRGPCRVGALCCAVCRSGQAEHRKRSRKVEGRTGRRVRRRP